MEAFYRELANNRTKGAALRAAQRTFIQGRDAGERYKHPYYWAPFFLVGDNGVL
jgi:CHAT domain-containing protein